jgi:hypothetical protein
MQKTNLFTPILALALFVMSIYTVYNNSVMNEKISKLQASLDEKTTISPIKEVETAEKAHKEEEAKEFPIGEYMGKLQYYAHKAGMAGKYQNWDLAKFYIHELEETVEFLVDKKIVDEGQDISKLLTSITPLIQQLETNAKEQNVVEFPKTYQTLLRNCNNCHISVNKPYIVIEIPKNDFDGQKFKK